MAFLGTCNDPVLAALRSNYYNLNQKPVTDLFPTQILASSGGNIRRLGNIETLFIAHHAEKLLKSNACYSKSKVGAVKTAELDAGIGEYILGTLVSAAGASVSGIRSSLAKARTIQFKFDFSDTISIEVDHINQILERSMINTCAPFFSEMLDADNLFIVTETIGARKINMIAKDSEQQPIKLDAATLQKNVGVRINVNSCSSENYPLSLEASDSIILGIRAVQLLFENGRFRVMKMSDTDVCVPKEMADEPHFLDVDKMLK